MCFSYGILKMEYLGLKRNGRLRVSGVFSLSCSELAYLFICMFQWLRICIKFFPPSLCGVPPQIIAVRSVLP